MSVTLFKHNEDAYRSAISMLERKGKAAIIHPTGTGKSFIAFKLCEDNPDKTFCWVSPSEYIYSVQKENLKRVCKDVTLNNIIFITYSKLMNMTEQELLNINPYGIILDEFHRCGAEQWGQGVNNLISAYPEAKILGLSATAIRYLDNMRDMSAELFDGNIASEITLGESIVRKILPAPKYIVSMFKYENELQKLTEKVEKTKNRYQKESAERYLELLKRTLENADGPREIFNNYITDKSGKYIVFCANYEHLLSMTDMAKEWFRDIDREPHIYIAYSENAETDRAFKEFKNDKTSSLKLLFCIDMLNEGIHIEDISGVILLRPTVSPIIYKQQIGRALSASKKKQPIIFDIVNNFENLYSISDIQQEMQLAINYYRELGETEILTDRFEILGEARDCLSLFDKIENTLSVSWDQMYAIAEKYYKENGNLDPTHNYTTEEGYSLGQWLSRQRGIRKGVCSGNLTAEQIAKLDKIGMRWDSVQDISWNKNIHALEQYFKSHGNIDVDPDYITKDGINLGKWILSLRTYYTSQIRKNYLTEDRIEKLNSMGMIWDKVNYLWEQNYTFAVKYYEQNHNLKLPRNYVTKEGIPLGAWLHGILYNYRRFGEKSITEDQKNRLETLGVEFTEINMFDRKWQQNYTKAQEYYEENGNLNVPYYYTTKDGFSLGVWLSNQRNKKLPETRKTQLDEIGMIWDTKKTDSWEKHFTLAKDYKTEHGNIDISSSEKYKDEWLGAWLNEQKKSYRNGTLNSKYIEKLESIGIDWLTSTERKWQNNYEELQSIFQTEGNLNIPRSNPELKLWLNHQRRKMATGKLTEKQTEQLSKIGVTKEISDKWNTAFEEVKAYFKKNNTATSIPKTIKSSTCDSLSIWLEKQTELLQNNKLSKDQERKLETIGIKKLTASEKFWQENYQAACTYYKEKGNIRIPQHYVTEKGEKLGEWLSNQRSRYAKNQLSEEKIQKLNKLNMVWNQTEADWEKGYAYATLYYSENGNLDVPSNYKTETGYRLGNWLTQQRQKKSKGTLTEKQIALLENIKITWSKYDAIWNDTFALAREYYLEHNDLNIPKDYITTEGVRLGTWLATQKQNIRKNELSAPRLQKLKELGIDF